MPFHTPDTPTTDMVCWVFTLPKSLDVRSLLMGALSTLTRVSNWQQVGTLTPLESASLFSEILLSQKERPCLIGAIIPAVWDTPPSSSYLLCDGHTELRQDFPRLYALLPSALILDADSFMTPDLRGKVIMGAGFNVTDDETYTPFTDYGENIGSITTEQLPPHTHDLAPHDHTTIPHAHTDAGHFHSLSLPTFLAIEPGEAPTYTPIGVPTPTLPTLPGFASILPETVVVNANSGQTTDSGTGTNDPISKIQSSLAVNYFLIGD
jgi:microcystin-dependent protein